MCWDSPANGVPSTARRARVFLRTRRYTPDLRAFARSSVMRPTSRPRYSATTTVFALANCAETSATIAFFLSRSRPKVYLQFVKSRPSSGLAAPTATLHSGKSCMGLAICVGRKERSNIDFSCRLNLSVPTVFDNPPRAVRAVQWPKVLSSISMRRRRAAAEAPPDHAHRVGARDHDVEIELSGLDAFGEILHADDVRARILRRLGLVALCKHGYPYLLARSGGQHHRSAHRLIGFLRVDAQIDRHIDGLVELRDRRLLDDLQGIEHGVIPVVLAQLRPGLLAFREIAHFTPSTVTPIERALPAIVRTAASRSAAVRSGILAFAISSAWARVMFPTLSVCGVLLPDSIPAAFLMRTVAGGVLMMKLKLLSW